MMPEPSEPLPGRQVHRLRPDVVVVPRSRDFVLTRADGRASVRLGRDLAVLIEPLRAGARRETLVDQLRARHGGDFGGAVDHALRRLERSGLLLGTRSYRLPSRTRSWLVFDANRVAGFFSAPLHALPPAVRRAISLVLAGAAAAAVCHQIMHFAPVWPGLSLGPVPVPDLVGVVIWLALGIPAHELAHAVACRLTGHAVGRAGLLLHGGLVPGPFVDTSRTYALAETAPRCKVALAGPFSDLMFAGAAAMGLLGLDPNHPVYASAATIMVLSFVFMLINLNPLRASDGSRALAAMLDDDLARQAALGRGVRGPSMPRTIRRYRFACAGYLLVLLLLAGGLWWSA